MIKTTCLLLLAALFHSVANANTLPNHDPVPGGVAIIPLESTAPTAPKVMWKNRPVMVRKQQDHWVAVVGIGLATEPGDQYITVDEHNKLYRQTFTITEKEYESQHITLKNKRQVNPNKLDMERINAEKKRIRTALSHWSDDQPSSLRLLKPVEGKTSSPYGLRRFFNEQPRKPHSGLDIAAPSGTLIKAPAPGTVIEQGDFFFNGNSLFIDHGQGLITMYCHMTQTKVNAGDKVAQGQIIGTVGKTGRATGPHLHWGVSLNDAMVNPLLFLPDEPAATTEHKE